MPMRRIDDDTVREVKRLLFSGHTYGYIQGETGVSIGAIYNIAKGRTYQEMPWPDGSVGELPRRVLDEVEKAKRRGAKRLRNSGDEQVRAAEIEMARNPVFGEQVRKVQRMLEEKDSVPAVPATKVSKYAEYLRKRAEREGSSGEGT